MPENLDDFYWGGFREGFQGMEAREIGISPEAHERYLLGYEHGEEHLYELKVAACLLGCLDDPNHMNRNLRNAWKEYYYQLKSDYDRDKVAEAETYVKENT